MGNGISAEAELAINKQDLVAAKHMLSQTNGLSQQIEYNSIYLSQIVFTLACFCGLLIVIFIYFSPLSGVVKYASMALLVICVFAYSINVFRKKLKLEKIRNGHVEAIRKSKCEKESMGSESIIDK